MTDVLRRNSAAECGLPIGQMHLALKRDDKSFETVSFYCTKLKNHHDACEFVGKELVVTRRRREDGKDRALPSSL